MTKREVIRLPADDLIYFDKLKPGDRFEAGGQDFIFEAAQEYHPGETDFWWQVVIRRGSDERYFWAWYGETSGLEVVPDPDWYYIEFVECFPHRVVTKVFKDFKE